MLTLSSSQPEVEDGEIINITCSTIDCCPPANIIWYKETQNSLLRLLLRYRVGLTTCCHIQYTSEAEDNGQQEYCKASNIEGERVESRFNVTCRNQKLSFSLSFYSPY